MLAYLREHLTEAQLSIYPEYGETKRDLARFFGVEPDDFVLTNGTDEAIQVLINTYVDDGDEVLILRPSYAMYRFYAEIAGARIRQIPYRAQKLAFPLEELLEAIGPSTRAVLIANPNNPTGTGTSRAGIERILDKAVNAAVLVDEAYYEFCGVTALPLLDDYPNLFVTRTFSKVYGMAAMRLGCLFSQSGNIEFAAQSPVALQREYRGGTRRARRDPGQNVCRKVRDRGAGRARAALCGSGKARHPVLRKQGQFRPVRSGQPRDSDPRRVAPPRRAGPRPQLRNRRLRAGHRGHARPDPALPDRTGEHLVSWLPPCVLVFDMDGVLVDVSESYRETIVRTVEIFTGQVISRELIQDYKNQGGYNNDWILSQKICRDLGFDVPYETIVGQFMDLFINHGLIHRERWIPREDLLEGLAERHELAIFTGRSTMEAEITLKREGWWGRFLLVSADDVEHEKPAPDGLLKVKTLRPGKRLTYIGDTVDDARAAQAAGVPFIGIAAPGSPRRDELARLLEKEGAIRVLGDINEIG